MENKEIKGKGESGIEAEIVTRGPKSQSDERLLAVLLGKEQLETARKLLPTGRITDLEFAVMTGEGKKARDTYARALALLELLERHRTGRFNAPGIEVRGAAQIAELTRHSAADSNESFYLVCVNSANRLIGIRKVASGDQTKINFNPRIVIEQALAMKAYRVAFVHNHPDGNCKPSGNDHQAMLALYGICHSVSIHVLDSVIVATDGYYSFANREKKEWGPETKNERTSEPSQGGAKASLISSEREWER